LATLKKATKSGKRKRKNCSTAIEEKEEKNPFFRLYNNTCLKIGTVAEKICTRFEAASTPPTNPVPSIKETIQMVEDCGVQEKTALMHTATMLIMKSEFREVFSSLKTNERRLDLLEREHEELMRTFSSCMYCKTLCACVVWQPLLSYIIIVVIYYCHCCHISYVHHFEMSYSKCSWWIQI
jgi:hypothetical protein